MVSGQLSSLLVDWTTAITELDLGQTKLLLEKEPELLWTPIPHIIDDHLQRHLLELNKLGSTFQPVNAIQFTCLFNQDINEAQQRLDFLSFLIEQSSLHDLDTRSWGEFNNTTMHLVCFLDYEPIVQLLIEKGVSVTPRNDLGYTPRDITTHESILDRLTQAQQKQKIKKDMSRTKSVRPNYSTPDRFKLLRELAEETSGATTDEPKMLNITIDRKKSEGHYFKKGKVKETQQKVLTEEEVVELEKQRQRRQLEVAQLVKKSAVKNNPLFKKLEKRAYPSLSRANTKVLATEKPEEIIAEERQEEQEEEQEEEPQEREVESDRAEESESDGDFDEDEEKPMKRNSKVISSLLTRSCVSSSVFVQADEDAPTTPIRRFSKAPINTDHTHMPMSPTKVVSPTATMTINELEGTITFTDDEEEEEDMFHEANSPPDLTHSEEVEGYYTLALENDKYYSSNKQDQESDFDSTDNEIEEEDDDEEEEEELTPVQVAKRLVPAAYQPVTIHHTKDNEKLSRDSGVEIEEREEEEREEEEEEEEEAAVTIIAPEQQEQTPSLLITNTANYVQPPARPQRSELRKSSYAMIAKQEQEQEQEKLKDKKRMSGSQKAAWTMSMSSWAAILDREFNLDELDPSKKYKEQQRLAQEEQKLRQELEKQHTEEEEEEEGLMVPSFSKNRKRTSSLIGLVSSASSTFSRSSTLHSSSRLSIRRSTATLVPPQVLPKLSSHTQSIRRKPISSTLLTPTEETLLQSRRSSSLIHLTDAKYDIPSSPPTSPTSIASIRPTYSYIPKPLTVRNSTSHGKLYLHVNGIQDILLPLPKDRAYVRCVVSDGRFEYMSRYEILSQSIAFDYECVIDTHPDMIITISLHVRPDYVMKSRLPFSRLFSSKKKKKECLSGYVNKEDGAIGQARFALAHMMPVCLETPYMAGFHCFNAWYSRSFKERHRQKKRSQIDPDQDVLKVVGNFDVEMLYLPTFDPTEPVPRNLRECDQIIQQVKSNSDISIKA